MPSIITTGKSMASIRRDSHSVSCALLSATKRRDTALFDTDLCISSGGSRSSVVSYRRVDTPAAMAAIVARFSGSACAAQVKVGRLSSPAARARARGRAMAMRRPPSTTWLRVCPPR